MSNHIDQLRELGVTHGFTLNLDRSIISDGVSVLIDIKTSADAVDSAGQAIQEESEVHSVYTAADSHVLVMTVCQPHQVHDLVARTVSDTEYTNYEVKLLTDSHSTPSMSARIPFDTSLPSFGTAVPLVVIFGVKVNQIV